MVKEGMHLTITFPEAPPHLRSSLARPKNDSLGKTCTLKATKNPIHGLGIKLQRLKTKQTNRKNSAKYTPRYFQVDFTKKKLGAILQNSEVNPTATDKQCEIPNRKKYDWLRSSHRRTPKLLPRRRNSRCAPWYTEHRYYVPFLGLCAVVLDFSVSECSRGVLFYVLQIGTFFIG